MLTRDELLKGEKQMKIRRILALLLALVLTLGTTALAAGSFNDVAEDAYYADAVAWAAEKEITTGYEDGTFRPARTVTRAEAVTFLWRMAGEPAPTRTETFTDVERDPNNGWYRTAVQWAVENGITDGMGNGEFRPAVTCSRGMILTMLYRMQGRPYDAALQAVVPEESEQWTMEDVGNWMVQTIVAAYREKDLLTDVSEGDWYELPVIWALNGSVLGADQAEFHTEGLKEDETPTVTVQPKADCPRGEMVSFLYRASGDAPVEGAVRTGEIPGTVLLDEGGVKVTAAKLRPEGLTDAVVELAVENGSGKTLRLDADEAFVNTYVVYPQVCIPTQSEDGWTFYADAVVAPGATTACELRLNSLGDMGITAVRELELRVSAVEVEADGDGGYNYVDDYAAGEAVHIRTGLYDESVSYDLEGTALLEKDGLKLSLLKAENSEYSGPEITLYAFNGGKDVSLALAEIRLDGVTYEGFFGMDIPAGKRCVSSVTVFIEDFDNIPAAKAAELTFCSADPESGETIATFDPVTVRFPASSDEAEAADGFQAVETRIALIDKYGNLNLAVSPEALREAGYAPGDLILVTIGDTEIGMPIGTNYTDVDAGKPICCLRTAGDGTEKTVLAIYSGNLAATAGIAEKRAIEAAPGYEWSFLDGYDASVPVVLTMVQKQGYADEYELHQLTGTRSNKREDYAALTDAEYANFRAVETTGMGKGTLYRSSSPVNPKLNRNQEADAALLQAQVRTVINLADSETVMEQYEGFQTTNCAGCDIIALDMGMDIQAEDFRQKLADGLRFIASHEGPYLIHCNEGKDRTGFAVAILEALMGADAGEIAADYMRTFSNFYGIGEETAQYQKIADSFLESSLAAALGISSVRDPDTDLQSAAQSYLKAIGMADDEIASLKARLAGDCGA